MKKIILIEILVLLLLICVAIYAITGNPLQPGAREPGQLQLNTAAPTDPPTEPPTELPTEPPTLPPVEIEMEENWLEVLVGHDLTAKQYFVYSLDDEEFLTVSDGLEDAHIFPASITKLYAAYIALQYIDPETVITVGSEQALIDPYSSVAKLQQGDELAVHELVAAMLLPSGNDATYALATAVGRILMHDDQLSPDWAVERFVYEMNSQADDLGLTGSHFITPDGIHDEDHYITLEDMVTIGKLALEHPVISYYAGSLEEEVVFSEERSLTWKNTNLLLNPESRYYCQYATGLKTGFTTPAGNCLLSAFTIEYEHLLIGVFGSDTSDHRYADTLYLFTQAYDLEIPDPPPAEETTEAEDPEDLAA